jgi:hypothetical protein
MRSRLIGELLDAALAAAPFAPMGTAPDPPMAVPVSSMTPFKRVTPSGSSMIRRVRVAGVRDDCADPWSHPPPPPQPPYNGPAIGGMLETG